MLNFPKLNLPRLVELRNLWVDLVQSPSIGVHLLEGGVLEGNRLHGEVLSVVLVALEVVGVDELKEFYINKTNLKHILAFE